jgi:hypothetical protein
MNKSLFSCESPLDPQFEPRLLRRGTACIKYIPYKLSHLQIQCIYAGYGSHACGNDEHYLLWYITLCSLIEIQRFGEEYCLHLQGRRVSEASRENACCAWPCFGISKDGEQKSSNFCFRVLFFDPEDGSKKLLRNIYEFLSDNTVSYRRIYCFTYLLAYII